MMGIFFLLNAETAASSESGFGFNFDILETNLINLGIVFILLIVYGGRVLGNILSERRDKIEQDIKEAEARKDEAQAALSEAQKNLREAQATAEKIRSEAEATSQRAADEILAKGQQEVERLKATAAADLDSDRQKAIAELRQRVVAMALEKVESRLGDMLDDDAQRQLIESSIAQIGE
ncbi:F0F1 ATP synthase subunit B [Myxosarcina sp. GI1(2024)]